jgi:hypothetical protein
MIPIMESRPRLNFNSGWDNLKELGGGGFGGAMVALPTGEVMAELPIGKEGILYTNV